MRARQFLVCTIIMCALCAYTFLPASADEDSERVETTYTLQSILAMTYANNPSLRAARAELASVKEQLPQAFAGWLPTVSADASIESSDTDVKSGGGGGSSDFASSSGGATTSKAVGVSLSQPLYRGGRTNSDMLAAQHVIRAQIARLVSHEQDTLLQAATAYMNVVRDRALLELSKNNKKVIEKQHEATKDRFEVGELTKTDVEQANARLANADAQIITARGDLRNSEAELEQIAGVMPGALNFPEALTLSLPDNVDEAALQAENSNPNIIAAVSTQRAAEEDVDGTYGELLPSLSLSASLNRSYDPAPGTFERQDNAVIGLVASIPLFQAGSVRSRVRQAKHVANQRSLDILDIKRQVRQRVTRSWDDLQTAIAEIKAREAQAEASSLAREGVAAETEFGARTVLDALDADQELLDAQVALVSAQRNKIVAEFTLLSVLGEITPKHIGFEAPGFEYDQHLDNFKWSILNMHVDRVKEK